MTSTLTPAMQRPQQPRTSRTPPPPSNTYHARSSSQSTITTPSTSRSRRPSLSNTMHWLSRSASPPALSPAYAPSKPIKIAEPKRARAIDSISPPARSGGTLGSGAIIVRTPDEALRETGVRLTPEVLDISRANASTSRSPSKKKLQGPSHHSTENNVGLESPPTPASPPLPPLPTLDSEDEKTLAESEPDSPGQRTPPRPNRPPPATPHAPVSRPPSLRSSLKVRTTSTVEEGTPSVPPLPANLAAFNQPPPFSAILLSDPPAMAMDAAKTIITIETCTETFKTTLNTLNSHPSYLSKYLSALCFFPNHESLTSIYSSESDDLSTYRRHLTSQGLLPHSSNIHVFLDRASSPYPHILSYLRSPVVEGQIEMLPRALQLQASQGSNVRLESLIEVRDEAAFLGLEGLHKLCTEEIRLRYGPRLHTRGQSNASAISVHSHHASVYSSHTLAERGEPLDNMHNFPISPLPSADTFPSVSPKEKHGSAELPPRRPPTPQSWEGHYLDQNNHAQRQSISRQSLSLKSPPAGWI